MKDSGNKTDFMFTCVSQIRRIAWTFLKTSEVSGIYGVGSLIFLFFSERITPNCPL